MKGLDSWILPSVVVLALLSLLFTLVPYVYVLGSSVFSAEPGEWGLFGDYVGGTLGTLITSITLILLVLSVDRQSRAISQIRDEGFMAQTIQIINMVSSDAQMAINDEIVARGRMADNSRETGGNMYDIMLREIMIFAPDVLPFTKSICMLFEKSFRADVVGEKVGEEARNMIKSKLRNKDILTILYVVTWHEYFEFKHEEISKYGLQDEVYLESRFINDSEYKPDIVIDLIKPALRSSRMKIG